MCMYRLYDLIVSHVIKEANTKNKVGGKEHKGKICDEEDLKVYLFNASDHGKSGK